LLHAMVLERLDDASRFGRRQEFVMKSVGPVLDHTAQQRHHIDLAPRRLGRLGHRARKFAAARDQAQGTQTESPPRRRARHNSCLASARMKSTISPTSVTPAY